MTKDNEQADQQYGIEKFLSPDGQMLTDRAVTQKLDRLRTQFSFSLAELKEDEYAKQQIGIERFLSTDGQIITDRTATQELDCLRHQFSFSLADLERLREPRGSYRGAA